MLTHLQRNNPTPLRNLVMTLTSVVSEALVLEFCGVWSSPLLAFVPGPLGVEVCLINGSIGKLY